MIDVCAKNEDNSTNSLDGVRGHADRHTHTYKGPYAIDNIDRNSVNSSYLS